jgi:hypothetical protein
MQLKYKEYKKAKSCLYKKEKGKDNKNKDKGKLKRSAYYIKLNNIF